MKSLRLQKPHLLIVVGIPGSGKTFFASQFAETFGAPYIHYQAIQTAPETELNHEDTARLADMLFRELIKTHQTIVLEGPGSSRVERLALARQAREADYEPLFVWVQTEPTTAQTRAVHGVRGGTNQLISEGAFDAAVGQFTPLNQSEKSVVISGKHTYATQAKTVLKRLVEPEIDSRKIPTATPVSSRPTRSGRITVQ